MPTLMNGRRSSANPASAAEAGGGHVRELPFALPIFAFYLLITIWVAAHHEIWSDESDPWLLMRDGGVTSLVQQTAYGHRGTPAGWFLAIWPFAAAGAPVVAQQVLNLAFAAAAVVLFLLYAPFPRYLRGLFAFSYIPAFEYAVIARPYALMMFLLFLMAAMWEKRAERPLLFGLVVALLANTTAHGLIFAGLAGILRLRDFYGDRRPRQAAGLAVMLAGGMASALALWPRAGGQHSLYRVELDTLWFALADAMFPAARTSTAVIPAVVILLVVVVAIGRRLDGQFMFWGSIVPLLASFVFIWVGGFRHTGIVLLAVLVSLWMSPVAGDRRIDRAVMICLAVSLAFSVLFASKAWVTETRLAFSGSRDAAQYIEKHLGGVPIAAHRPMASSPILSYLPGRQFWYPARGEWGSFMRWNRTFQLEQDVPVAVAIERARQEFSGRKWALLLTQPLPDALASAYVLGYQTDRSIWNRHDETYWIYTPTDELSAPGSQLSAAPPGSTGESASDRE